MESYFYAYGQNETIDVFWDYIGDDDVIGCNLFRSEDPWGQYTQINDELIIPIDNEFHYIDSDTIIDTINYSYKFEYVFADSIFNSSTYGSFKDISLEILDEDSIELIVILRNSYLYELRWYVDWCLYYYSLIIDSLTLVLTPEQLQGAGEDYIFMFSELINPLNTISFHLTYDYLIHLLNISGSDINQIYPEDIILKQNYPNPFNPITTISFTLPNDIVDPAVKIFNIKGEVVKNILINTSSYRYLDTVVWNGTDNSNKPVSSGVYLYRIYSDNYLSETKQMILLK